MVVKMQAKVVRTTDKGRALIERRVKLLTDLTVMAGVQDKEARDTHPGGGVTIGEVAAFVHFGTVFQPARPYMDRAIADIKQDVRGPVRKVVVRTVAKSKSPVRDLLKPVGKVMAGAVRDAIGFVGAVDTGALQGAAAYTVRKGDRVLERGKP